MPLVKLDFPIDPCAKPRMTQRDKWMVRPCVAYYRLFKDLVTLRLRELEIAIDDLPPYHLNFYLKAPKNKPKLIGTPHKSRPDIDNLIKGWFDAAYAEDSQIWSISASKYWDNHGHIELIYNESRQPYHLHFPQKI